MVYQIVLKKGGMVMLMEDSDLLARATETYNYKPVMDLIMSILDKCKDLNVKSEKWSKPPNANITNDTPDPLKQAIDVTMERLETWLPKSWADLVKELRSESEVAYDKFSKLRKKYRGLIEISRGNGGSELIKAYIARDIQDYVKYGINICLLFYMNNLWVRTIATHFKMLAQELEGLNVGNEKELRRLAEDVSLYKQCMLDFANNSAECLCESNSEAYMMLRQKGGIPFSNLIERQKNKLGFAIPFTELECSEQDEVYQSIVNEFDGENVQFVDFLFAGHFGGIYRYILKKR